MNNSYIYQDDEEALPKFTDVANAPIPELLVGPKKITYDLLRSWPMPEPALYGGRYRRGQVTLLAGPTGVGKSTLIMRHLFDMAKQGLRSVLISAEDSHENYIYSLLAISEHDNCRDDEVVGRINLFSSGFSGGILETVAGVLVPSASLIDDLVRHVGAYEPDILVLETLSTMIPTDESNQAFSAAANALKILAEKLKCSVVISHHPRKAGTNGHDDAVDSVRGGSSLTGAVREVLFLRKPYVAELELIGVEKDSKESRDYVVLQHSKCSSGRAVDNQVYQRFSVMHPDNPEIDLAPIFRENRSIGFGAIAEAKEAKRDVSAKLRTEGLLESFAVMAKTLEDENRYVTATAIRKRQFDNTEYSGQTVASALKSLCDQGLVVKQQVQNREGGRMVDVYKLSTPIIEGQEGLEF
jgi:hypothetical protein